MSAKTYLVSTDGLSLGNLLVRAVKPQKQSLIIRLFAGVVRNEATFRDSSHPKFIGDIFVYGFGQGMDEHGRILTTGHQGEIIRTAPDRFDAILQLPDTIARKWRDARRATITAVPIQPTTGAILDSDLVELGSVELE